MVIFHNGNSELEEMVFLRFCFGGTGFVSSFKIPNRFADAVPFTVIAFKLIVKSTRRFREDLDGIIITLESDHRY